MKNLFVLAVVAMFAVSANAQYYIGGSFGFESNTTKPKAEGFLKTTSTGLTFAPEFGYSLDDKTDIGVAFGVSSLTEKTGELKSKSNSFAISPYYRYAFLTFGSFQVTAKTSAFFATGKEEPAIGDKVDVTSFGLGVVPVLKYGLSDRLTLLSNLNFARFTFSQTKRKDISTVTNVGVGVNTFDFQTLGDIAIGFAYSF